MTLPHLNIIIRTYIHVTRQPYSKYSEYGKLISVSTSTNKDQLFVMEENQHRQGIASKLGMGPNIWALKKCIFGFGRIVHKKITN